MAIDSSQAVERPRIFKFGEGVYVRREIDNMGWIDLGDSTAVVDTLEQPSAAKEVLTEMERTVGSQPVRYVLNTHLHPDHVALNPLFERRGAEIINAATRNIPPDGLQIDGTNRSLRMIPIPGCHTPQDCVVWLPAEKVLFVGDFFGWGLIPWMGNLKKERRQLILDTCQRLIDFKPQTVVPGHGPLCSDTELARWRDYVLWLIDEIEGQIARGVPPENIGQDNPAPPDDMLDWWRFAEWKHQDSVKKVVKAIVRQWN